MEKWKVSKIHKIEMLFLQNSKGTNTSNYKSVFQKIDFIFSLSAIRTKQALLSI